MRAVRNEVMRVIVPNALPEDPLQKRNDTRCDLSQGFPYLVVDRKHFPETERFTGNKNSPESRKDTEEDR